MKYSFLENDNRNIFKKRFLEYDQFDDDDEYDDDPDDYDGFRSGSAKVHRPVQVVGSWLLGSVRDLRRVPGSPRRRDVRVGAGVVRDAEPEADPPLEHVRLASRW